MKGTMTVGKPTIQHYNNHKRRVGTPSVAPRGVKRTTPLATKWRWLYTVGKVSIVVTAYSKSEARSLIKRAIDADRLPAGATLERLPPEDKILSESDRNPG